MGRCFGCDFVLELVRRWDLKDRGAVTRIAAGRVVLAGGAKRRVGYVDVVVLTPDGIPH